ncbi:MAG TPA: hypothetical protein VG326_03665 [Tepidisphaeraceae bacterium]|jgi:hypothetical protein|nr:hypothetical protein [Tepidisphaeraceae bacterium]
MTPSPEAVGAFERAVRAVLLHDWDPHNAAGVPAAHGAYDLYVRPLAEAIRGGASESQIVVWLHEREQESMCFPPMGTQRLKRIAMKLLAIERTSYDPDAS